MSLLKELIQLNEEIKGLGDPSFYKVKNVEEYTDNGKKRVKFKGYKKRNGKFVSVGYFSAPAGTPEDKLWKEIDKHFQKHDDGVEDDD